MACSPYESPCRQATLGLTSTADYSLLSRIAANVFEKGGGKAKCRKTSVMGTGDYHS